MVLILRRLTTLFIVFRPSWNAEDAMRRDDKAGEVEPIADTAVSVGLLALSPIAHDAASLRPLAEALHADEEVQVWRPVQASHSYFL